MTTTIDTSNHYQDGAGLPAFNVLQAACDGNPDEDFACRAVNVAHEAFFSIRRGSFGADPSRMAVGDGPATVFFDNNPCDDRELLMGHLVERLAEAGLTVTGAGRTDSAYSIGIVINAPLETAEPVIEAACAELGFAVNSTLSGRRFAPAS